MISAADSDDCDDGAATTVAAALSAKSSETGFDAIAVVAEFVANCSHAAAVAASVVAAAAVDY